MKYTVVKICITLLTLTFVISCSNPVVISDKGVDIRTGNIRVLTDVLAGSGTLTLSPESADSRLPRGTTITVSFQPASGWIFEGWEDSSLGNNASLSLVLERDITLKPIVKKRGWTWLLYMSADNTSNSLDPFAMADLKALESVTWAGSGHTVLALLDRGPVNNTDWQDTRMYEIKNNSSPNTVPLASKWLTVPELGLQAQVSKELNMGDPSTLSNATSFLLDKYPAEHYGLILWGHGSGWRSPSSAPSPTKLIATDLEKLTTTNSRAFVFDDTAGDVLVTKELGTGVRKLKDETGQGWDVVGINTCNGAMIEVAYELKDNAQFMVADQDNIPSAGWPLKTIFDAMVDQTIADGNAAGKLMYEITAASFINQSYAVVSHIDLSKIDALNTAWNNWCVAVRNVITDLNSANVVRNTLSKSTEDFYSLEGGAGELNIDMYDAASKVKGAIGAPSVQNASDAVMSALNQAVPLASTSSQNPRAHGLSIHLVPITDVSGTVHISIPHSDAYKKGSTVLDAPSFVNQSKWCPSSDNQNLSLLDGLWYAY